MANAFNILTSDIERVEVNSGVLYYNREEVEINSTDEKSIIKFKLLKSGQIKINVSGRCNQDDGVMKINVYKNGEIIYNTQFSGTSLQSFAYAIDVNENDIIEVKAYMSESGYDGIISSKEIYGWPVRRIIILI